MHAHPFHVVLCIAWPRPARLIIRRTIVPWIMDRCSPLPIPYSHFHESRTFRILRSSLVSSAIPTIPPPPPHRNPFFARSLISTVSNRFFLLYFIVCEYRLHGMFLFLFSPFFLSFLLDGFFLLFLVNSIFFCIVVIFLSFLFLYLFNFIFFSSFFLIFISFLLFFPYFSQFYLYIPSFLSYLLSFLYISSRLILLYFSSFNFLPRVLFPQNFILFRLLHQFLIRYFSHSPVFNHFTLTLTLFSLGRSSPRVP